VNDHGYHWTPCRGGRGGGGAVLVVLAVVVAAACARPAVQAAVGLVEIAAVVAGVLLVVSVVVAVAVWQVRRGRARAARAARPPVLTAVREPVVLDGRHALGAIEPPRARVSAYPRIDAQPHVVTGDDGDGVHCPYPICHHNHPELSPHWQRRGEAGRDG